MRGLFLAADKLRKNLEPSDYKHVALGLIFLKHISNAFEARREALLAEDPAGRIQRRERVLGASRSALVTFAGQCEAAAIPRNWVLGAFCIWLYAYPAFLT
jgi:hypothetical protein